MNSKDTYKLIFKDDLLYINDNPILELSSEDDYYNVMESIDLLFSIIIKDNGSDRLIVRDFTSFDYSIGGILNYLLISHKQSYLMN
jgi:hypothetical protein